MSLCYLAPAAVRGAVVFDDGVLGVGDGQVNDGVVSPGEFCDVGEFDSVAGGEVSIECVSGFVRGFGDQLGEADVVQVLQEGDGVGVVGVVDVEVEVPRRM